MLLGRLVFGEAWRWVGGEVPRPPCPTRPRVVASPRSAAPDPPRSFSCLSPAVLYPRCNATPSPPSPYAPLPRAEKPPRSSADLPRRAPDLPRSIPDLPRSSDEVPRRAPIRASLGPARFTRASLEAKPRSPIAPLPRFAAVAGFAVLPRSPLSQTATRCNNRPRRPAFRCRPWSCPASVLIAGNDSRRQARIAEAENAPEMRSEATIRREAAQTEGRAHERQRREVAARRRARRRPRRTRGWLCAELSPPHWIGGDARRKAVNRARQFFRQARLNEKRRARFWAASPTASPPSFAENPLEARSTHLRQDEHTLKSDPRPMAHARATLGTSGVQANRARGWDAQGNSLGNAKHNTTPPRGKARAAVGETQRTTPTPTGGTRQSHRWEDAPRTSTPTPPRRGATAIQPPSWDFSRTSPSARVWWL